MKKSMFLLLTSFMFSLFFSCNNSKLNTGFDEEKERDAIIKMSEDMSRILVNKDIDKLMELESNYSVDTSIYVTRGNIFKIPSKKSKEKVLQSYGLDAGKYLELKYLDKPIIQFSKDGSIAWEIGKLKMVYEYIDSTGKADTSILVNAYLQLYEKKDGKWLYGDIAQTFDK